MGQHVDKTDAKYQFNGKVFPRHLVDAVDKVLEVEGPQRWRRAAAVWINLNPVDPESGLDARTEYRLLVHDLKKKRETLKTSFGEIDALSNFSGGIKSSSEVREMFSIPAGLDAFIKMFDPMAFDKENPEAQRNLVRFRKEFPEFCVAEKV